MIYTTHLWLPIHYYTNITLHNTYIQNFELLNKYLHQRFGTIFLNTNDDLKQKPAIVALYILYYNYSKLHFHFSVLSYV
jgi:hypothetical protein